MVLVGVSERDIYSQINKGIKSSSGPADMGHVHELGGLLWVVRSVLGVDQLGVHVSDDGVLSGGHGGRIAGYRGWCHDLKVVYSLWKMKVIMRIVA